MSVVSFLRSVRRNVLIVSAYLYKVTPAEKSSSLQFFNLNILCLCLYPLGFASGLQITSPGGISLEKASGESVTLDCQFKLDTEDSGPLDIEWSLLASDNQKNDEVVCAKDFFFFNTLPYCDSHKMYCFNLSWIKTYSSTHCSFPRTSISETSSVTLWVLHL